MVFLVSRVHFKDRFLYRRDFVLVAHVRGSGSLDVSSSVSVPNPDQNENIEKRFHNSRPLPCCCRCCCCYHPFNIAMHCPFSTGTVALWLKVPTDFCHFISIASHYGFQLHHTQPKYLMMCLWLPEDVPNKVPPYGTHHVGVAGSFVPLSCATGSNSTGSSKRRWRWRL